MITDLPVRPLFPAPPLRIDRSPIQKAPVPAVSGSLRYECQIHSRKLTLIAALFSAALHAGLLFGFSHAKKKAAPAPEDHFIVLTDLIPQLKELEEPDPVANDEPRRPEDLSAPAPMQADLPQLPRPNDFVQQLDFSSLIERPDFSQAKIVQIPENIRRGGKIVESMGPIFNLSDLDRIPEALFQPAPVYPVAMKQNSFTATVTVEFIVDPQGRAVNAVVFASTHEGFNEAAVQGVAKWKFRAGVRGGRKVNTQMRVPIVFRFDDQLDQGAP